MRLPQSRPAPTTAAAVGGVSGPVGELLNYLRDLLRHPNDVTSDVEEGDVMLRRRDQPDLRLSRADRDAERAVAFAAVGRTLRNLLRPCVTRSSTPSRGSKSSHRRIGSSSSRSSPAWSPRRRSWTVTPLSPSSSVSGGPLPKSTPIRSWLVGSAMPSRPMGIGSSDRAAKNRCRWWSGDGGGWPATPR